MEKITDFVIPVEAHIHSEIQGEIVPDLLGSELEKFGVVYLEEYLDLDKYSIIEDKLRIKELNLRKLSEIHGRSEHIEVIDRPKGGFLDQFDNLFHDLSIKGNNLTIPEIYEDELSSTGFSVHGMQNGQNLVRCLRASHEMRRLGIDTEMIIGVIEPLEVLWKGEIVGINEFRSKLLAEAIVTQMTEAGGALKPEWLSKVTEFTKEEMLVFTVRAMSSNIRMADLIYHGDSGLIRFLSDDDSPLIRDLFSFVNQREKRVARIDPEYIPLHFDPTRIGHRYRYLVNYLPDQLGRNFGKLHKADLLHRFPHAGNILLSGGICDNDSIIGERLGLGDEKVLEGAKIEEIFTFLNGSDRSSFNVGSAGMIDVLQQDKPEIKDEMFKVFRQNFLVSYIAERGLDTDLIKNFDTIVQGYHHGFDLDTFELTEMYLRGVFARLGWKFGEKEEEIAKELFIASLRVRNQVLSEIALEQNPDISSYKELEEAIERLHDSGSFSEEIEDKTKSQVKTKYLDLRRDDIAKATSEIVSSVIEEEYLIEDFWDAVAQLVIAYTSKLKVVAGELEPLMIPVVFQNQIELIKKLGWEVLIERHIEQIIEAFDDFGNIHMLEPLNYYINLMAESMKISYRILMAESLEITYRGDESIEDLITEFSDWTQEDMKGLGIAVDKAYFTGDLTDRYAFFYNYFVVYAVNSKLQMSMNEEQTRMFEQNKDLQKLMKNYIFMLMQKLRIQIHLRADELKTLINVGQNLTEIGY